MPPAKERPSPFDKHLEASSSAIAHGFSTVFALGPQPRPGTSSSAGMAPSAKGKGKGAAPASAPLPAAQADLPNGEAILASETGSDWLRSLRDFTGYKGAGGAEPSSSNGGRKGAEVDGAAEDGEDSDEEDEDDADSPAPKGKGGKKVKAVKKGAKLDESTAEQRKAQNRIAQREFRQRKQQYIRALEARVELLSSDHDTQVDRLRFGLRALVNENNQLRTMVGSLAAFIGSKQIGGPLSHAGLSREELEEMIGTSSEKTVTDAWTAWPGAKESEALRQIRLESNLPPEGLPESCGRGHANGDTAATPAATKKRKATDDGSASGRSQTGARTLETTSGTRTRNNGAAGPLGPEGVLQQPAGTLMPAPLPPDAQAATGGANMVAPATLPAPILEPYQQSPASAGLMASMSMAGHYLQSADPQSCPAAIAASQESVRQHPQHQQQLREAPSVSSVGTPSADAFLASLFGADSVMSGFAPQGSNFTANASSLSGMTPTSASFESRDGPTLKSQQGGALTRASPASSSHAAAPRNQASPAQSAINVATPPIGGGTVTAASTPGSDRGHHISPEVKATYRNLVGFSNPLSSDGKSDLKAVPGLVKQLLTARYKKRPQCKSMGDEPWKGQGMTEEQELERVTAVAVHFKYHIINFRKNPAYSLPPLLRPSELQQSKPHDPLIDGIPLVRMRDKLIAAQDRLPGDDVIFCLLEHTRLHDGDFFLESSWEVNKDFFKIYPELFDDEELKIINRWRASRGEKALTREEVLRK